MVNDLLQTHKCYLNEINYLFEQNIKINGLCHITGGGLYNNLKRVVPSKLSIQINEEKILNNTPEVFSF